MPKVPLDFSTIENIFDDVDEEFEIEIIKGQDIWEVFCPILGLRIFHPPSQFYPSELIEQHTPDLRLYEKYGYSLGNFHEFLFTNELLPLYHFYLEDVEVSLGVPTPIAEYLFFQDRKDVGWEYFRSLRFFGINQENIEVYLLNALTHIKTSTGIDIDFTPIDIESFFYPDDLVEEFEVQDKLHIFKDVEPLRLYHYAITFCAKMSETTLPKKLESNIIGRGEKNVSTTTKYSTTKYSAQPQR